MTDAIKDAMTSWVEEALELRHGAAEDPEGKLTEPDPAAGIQGVLDMLIRVRQRADRVDELLAKITRARGRTRRNRDETLFSADLAFDTALVTQAAMRGAESYATKEDRNAGAMLATIEQKREAHQAKMLVSLAEESFDVITQVHWQLDAMRKDLRAQLHALQFESGLER